MYFQITIDTIFLCFCEDCERNDGVSKPYYMSKNLMVSCISVLIYLGLVVQSIVTLTSWLVVRMLTVLVSTISN